jgi:hypothetical protein
MVVLVEPRRRDVTGVSVVLRQRPRTVQVQRRRRLLSHRRVNGRQLVAHPHHRATPPPDLDRRPRHRPVVGVDQWIQARRHGGPRRRLSQTEMIGPHAVPVPQTLVRAQRRRPHEPRPKRQRHPALSQLTGRPCTQSAAPPRQPSYARRAHQSQAPGLQYIAPRRIHYAVPNSAPTRKPSVSPCNSCIPRLNPPQVPSATTQTCSSGMLGRGTC